MTSKFTTVHVYMFTNIQLIYADILILILFLNINKKLKLLKNNTNINNNLKPITNHK